MSYHSSMIINLTYIFCILVAIYFAIDAYVYTRKWQVFPLLFVFLFSLWLEIDWMMKGDYQIYANDFLWTSRDIIRTIAMILFFGCMKECFPYKKKSKK